MILFDMSNIAYSSCMGFHQKTKEQPSLPVMRNLITERILAIRKKLLSYADEIVFCFDGHKAPNWRRLIFPEYKAGRAKSREADDGFDWTQFFSDYDTLKEEFRQYFPVRCIEIDNAEADDIIAILSLRFVPRGPVCIVSSDKDMIQLQQLSNMKIKQWSPWHNAFLSSSKKQYNLMEHILRGDGSDGIPNFLSDSDAFVNPEKRQTRLMSSFVAKCLKHDISEPEKFCPDEKTVQRFKQNKALIDMREIPSDVSGSIIQAYENTPPARNQLHTYFAANRMARFLGAW